MSHVAEQFPWAPSPSCAPPGRPFRIKSLALSARSSLDSAFPSVRQELTLGVPEGHPPFLQHHHLWNTFHPCSEQAKRFQGSEARRLLSVKDGWEVSGYFPAFCAAVAKTPRHVSKSPCRSPHSNRLDNVLFTAFIPSPAPFSEAKG